MRRIVTVLLCLLGIFTLTAGCNKEPEPLPELSAEITGEWKLDEGTISRVTTGEIDGITYLFLTTITGGMPHAVQLYILDVSKPASPVEVSRTDVPFKTIVAIVQPALAETTLYLPFLDEQGAGIWVVDVSVPESPKDVTTIPVMYGLIELEVSDDLLCAATFPSGSLLFFDIADRVSPRQSGDELRLSQEQPFTSHLQMKLDGDMLYVANECGLALVDVSEPSSAYEAGFYKNPDRTEQQPEAVPNIPESGMTRTSRPDNMLDGLFPSGAFLDVDASGSYAYIAGGDSGLVVIDVSNPNTPKEAARLNTGGRAHKILMAGNLAFILDSNFAEGMFSSNIRVIDISNPSDPQPADSIEDIKEIPVYQSLVEANNQLYFLNNDLIRVIDIYWERRY